jgi:hypothetical protein
MNNTTRSKTSAESHSSSSLQAILAQLDVTLNSARQVVICPLSLPDANWPEGLKHINDNAKIALNQLLQGRSFEIFNVEDMAIQKVGLGESIIFHLLGFKAPDTPAAFSTAQIPTPYIAIRPVSLHAGRDHVVLKQSDGSYATHLQLKHLAAAITPLFEDYGLALHTPYAPDTSVAQWARWFVTPISDEGKQFFELTTSDSQQALGRNIDAYMAKGQSARRWRQLETEIQMTWFDHPVNTELRSKNLDELNSIWIDGSISDLPKKPIWLNQIDSKRASFAELANFWKLPDSSNIQQSKTGNLRICDDWQGRLYGDALTWLQAWELFLNQQRNLAPDNLVVFAGETSCVIIEPIKLSFKNEVARRIASVLQSLTTKTTLDRPEVIKAFDL